MKFNLRYFTQSQRNWIQDNFPLKIIQKSRQIGISHADNYHSVSLASRPEAKFDVFISSRDEFQAKLSLENCREWAQLLHLGASDLGEVIFDEASTDLAGRLAAQNLKSFRGLS